MIHLLHNKKIMAAILGLVVIIAAALAIPAIFPKDQQVLAGQKVVVTVTASSVNDMYGYQFQMDYNTDDFAFSGELVSKISDIQTIFSKSFTGYELVGATMIGEKAGFSGKNLTVCQMAFTAQKDGMLSEMPLSLSNVNIVKSDLAYDTGMLDWKCKMSIAA